MATRKKTTPKTTKKTTKKSPCHRSTPSRTSSRPPARTTPTRTSTPDLPPARTTPRASNVPIQDYVHMQQRQADFLKEHPDGVYFHADAASKGETESALRSLEGANRPPVFITSKKTFTAAELQRMGFEVFQNGQGGKLVGIRK